MGPVVVQIQILHWKLAKYYSSKDNNKTRTNILKFLSNPKNGKVTFPYPVWLHPVKADLILKSSTLTLVKCNRQQQVHKSRIKWISRPHPSHNSLPSLLNRCISLLANTYLSGQEAEIQSVLLAHLRIGSKCLYKKFPKMNGNFYYKAQTKLHQAFINLNL